MLPNLFSLPILTGCSRNSLCCFIFFLAVVFLYFFSVFSLHIRLLDVMFKLSLLKGSVLRHMVSVIQPILEKGIVDHSIIHRLLLEYFSIADQLSSPLLVRMIGTKDGAKIGILCVKCGNAKVSLATSFLSIEMCNALMMIESDIFILFHFPFQERKKIIKGLKGHIDKTAYHQYGYLVSNLVLFS
ncbi:putative armadillo-like helical protein [Lupinus albus]|uniref:Putative armadillo-like helical protein n=1 Tax=Lupinus albus TaxID=3870 RepID=A0A6A4PLX3_LUPAL|nr:putative armadillo-like helical protein [Lupinus albus]